MEFIRDITSKIINLIDRKGRYTPDVTYSLQIMGRPYEFEEMQEFKNRKKLLGLDIFETKMAFKDGSVFIHLSPGEQMVFVYSTDGFELIDCDSLFLNLTSVKCIDLSDVEFKPISCNEMFRMGSRTIRSYASEKEESEYSKLESIIWGEVDTSNCESFFGMFEGCKSLKEIDLSKFDTAKAVSMHSMFSGCNSLEYVDLSCVDTSRVEDMAYMFNECYALKNVKFGNLASVDEMYYAFEKTTSLESVDFSNTKLNNLKSISHMFLGSGIRQLDMSNINFSNLEQADYMLAWTERLNKITMNNVVSSKIMQVIDEKNTYNTDIFYAMGVKAEVYTDNLDIAKCIRDTYKAYYKDHKFSKNEIEYTCEDVANAIDRIEDLIDDLEYEKAIQLNNENAK